MIGKSKTECCNGDCNQGRDCPIRKEWRKNNALNWTSNKFGFTLTEFVVLVIGFGLVLYFTLR